MYVYVAAPESTAKTPKRRFSARMMCYAGTSYEGIRVGYVVGEICRRLQAMQAITW